MKHTLKGGTWTNVEDEILKVAVMKYGRNQWARISSLLVRKTPKQCKARWNEWLDPRIKKTEWSREEDEKLLHLAKVFPSQWGTISDTVGRTAQMCLERYETLLDQAAASNMNDNEPLEDTDQTGTSKNATTSATTTTTTNVSLADSRRLRPGEVDPSPETKAARPDPVDMDEDEKEMLAEARARLANTQGKKAKRKAREKLLDEARRAAALQKRKELIAAGLPGISFRHRGMNYNSEIPFERKAAPGLYDTTEELEEEVEEIKTAAMEKRTVVKTKEAIELAERRKDVKKQKARTEAGFLPAALERKLREQQNARRALLNLPAPQIDESDLEQIAKYGLNNLEMNLADTPLTGMMNASSTPFFSKHHREGNMTPMSSTMSVVTANTAITNRTPIRDHLGLNTSARMHHNSYSTEPLDSASLMDVANKSRLRSAFSSLPKPKNDFDLVIPEHESSSNNRKE